MAWRCAPAARWTLARGTGIGAALLVVATGCRMADREPDAPELDPRPGVGVQPAPPAADTPAAEVAELRLEVSLEARRLRVLENGQEAATYPVAVGQPEYPTPTGEYTIDEVVLNPEWIPPDSDWAEDEEPTAPGAPDNPLGHAQLVYERPYSIHGTRDLESLGRAASHGSIRVSNQAAEELARMAMEAGGVEGVEGRLARARENRTEQQVVRLTRPVPIRIVDGAGGAADR